MLILAASALLELLLYTTKLLWRARKAMAVAALAVGAFGSGALLLWCCNAFSIILALLAMYRLFNLARVIYGRLHAEYLRAAARRTFLMILASQLVVGAAWFAWSELQITGQGPWTVLAMLQLAAALIFLASIIRSLRRTKWQQATAAYADSELPTVSVAIPARNETEDLQQCLQSLIASDYPKLEILVLDDCSQNKRTPEIIRGFAHDGVRFLQGREPHESWLAKNQAYDRLADEANGQLILFCGVDARFAPDSLRALVTALKAKNKRMMSILPLRSQAGRRPVSLIQAMRYWWELVPPRRLFNRPPVLSSCWIIERRALQEAGGFEAVRRMITPEAHFARALVRRDDSYSFMRADEHVGISSAKQISAQRDTAIRTRYPQLHRRPENVALLSMWQLVFLLAPFVLTVAGFFISIGALAHLLAAVSSVVLTAVYVLTITATHVKGWSFMLADAPVAVLTDIVLLHYSMARYEFSTVEWKGRNVCVPVMQAVPKLPEV